MGGPSAAIYEFGGFRLDAEQQLLFREGLPVPLTPKAVQTLLVLVRNAGRLVDKEHLIHEVWPDSFVEEGGLTRNISVLRKVLGGEGEEENAFIETVPRRGYRFVAPVQVAPIEPAGQPPAPAPAREPRATRRRMAWLGVGLAAAAVAAALAVWRAGGTTAPRVLLAVLPFENVGGDPEQEYLSDGLTGDMITELGRLWPDRLGVIARTSAMTYKGAAKTVIEVGRELNVDYVLEGSVRPLGDRLRVSAQLIQVRDQAQVWAERYDRPRGDLLALQGDVARAIARAIPLELTGEEEARLSRPLPARPEAQEAYLRGRYHWNKRSEEDLRKAVGYFEEAIAADPGWAPAYSGLADTYITQFDYGLLPAAEAGPRTRDAARKALELDPMLAEAHNSLAHLSLHDWDWAGAEREFRRALELDPGYIPGYHWYALCLTAVGRTDEAVEAMQRARDLDPLSLRINGDLGMALMAAGRHDEAIAQEKKTLELDPSFRGAYWIMGMAYQQKGNFEEAIRSYQEALERAPGNPNFLAALGHVYAVSGRTAEARKIAAELTQRASQGVSPFFIALVHTGLGDKDQAFAWLEKAYAERSGSVRYLKVERRLDPLRSDSRYRDLLRRLGLS
jgi:TolB-like protein/DNA-binding winged helix-turn-helix (wHTH) protein/Tfp pilus assembly protein PilF